MRLGGRFLLTAFALDVLTNAEGFVVVSPGARQIPSPSNNGRAKETKVHLKFPFFMRENQEEKSPDRPRVTSTGPTDGTTGTRSSPIAKTTDEADVVIVGGGVSGLTAAIKAAEGMKKKNPDAKVILIEANSGLGGRVMSEETEDGFVLDKGFAVFIEEYPEAKKLLDYDALKLKPFLPGALVKLKSRNRLARVADPLRVPADTLNAVLAPVGSLFDKVKVLPLIFNVRTKSIEELFEERETDTETALIERWGFSDDFIEKFYKPFLEGIYLAPLSKQSSRMFSFVFKMFSEGSATLPAGGIGAVSKQLTLKAANAGVDIRTNMPVSCIGSTQDGFFTIDCVKTKQKLRAATLVVATDGNVAQKLISNIPGFENLDYLPEQPQLSVGCLYYSFKGPAPIEEPILILNGVTDPARSKDSPVNNVCFPSVVNDGYAPDGYSLCSVTVLSDAMKLYQGKPEDLDTAVRRQLGTWFRDQRSQILDGWELEKIYFIPNAQPSQFKGPFPASVNGGRPTNTFRGKDLPNGMFVCGDHMATATLNGALESGAAAGQEAAKAAAKAKSNTKTAAA